MVEACRRWVEEFVIGLDLCPFARAPWAAGAVRFSESRAEALEELVAELLHEAEVSPTTTLLIAPRWSFEDLLDAAAIGDELLPAWKIVVFHPDFRFADSDPGDPANGVNRSPAGMLHLLRRRDLKAAAASHPDVDGIPERNARLLRAQGKKASPASER